MKTSQRYLISVLALGWIVLVACSVILFWTRYCTWFGFAGMFWLRDDVSTSNLDPEEIKRDPNVHRPSYASASTNRQPQDTLWIWEPVQNRWSQEGDWPILHVAWDAKDGSSHLTYWDGQSGLFVRRVIQTQGTNKLVLQGHLYAGPEGISERPGNELGRFVRPIVSSSWTNEWPCSWQRIVYDRGLRQIYRIDFDNKKVLKGPPIPQGIEPLQIGRLGKNQGMVNGPDWRPPMRKAQEGDTDYRKGDWVPIEPNMMSPPINQIMVLDTDGQIYRLDLETLTLSSMIGSLPTVGLRSSNNPHDLLAYDIRPVQIHDRYAGCLAAAMGAEGTTLEMSVYDKDGYSAPRPGSDSYRPVFQHSPGASGALASQYLLECLYPLSLSLLSRAIGPQVEALAGHRGLFVLPNSFIATRARQQDSYPIDRLFWTVVMLLPATLLAAFLAWKAAKDASTIGLSRTATRWWIVGIAAFGLAAYITYRLTRPQAGLVTCANCGNLRRSDMERCHRCRAPWSMPDLTPPAWRVMD